MTRIFKAAVLAVALAALAACDNGGVTVLSPDQSTITDTFSANVAAGGTNSFSFSTKAAGAVQITLVNGVKQDQSTIPLLVGIGTPDALGACNVPAGAQAVLQMGTSVTSVTVTTAGFGSFCLTVSDFQTLGPASYTIQVKHT